MKASSLESADAGAAESGAAAHSRIAVSVGHVRGPTLVWAMIPHCAGELRPFKNSPAARWTKVTGALTALRETAPPS